MRYQLLKLKHAIFLSLTALIMTFAFQNCGQGFKAMNAELASSSGSPGSAGPGGVVTDGLNKIECSLPDGRGSSDTNLRRLNSYEFQNTMRDLVGSTVVDQTPSVGLLANDLYVKSVDEVQDLHNFDQVDALVRISMDLATNLVGNRTALAAVSPTCVPQGLNAGSLSDACVQSFITAFGLKAFRRPLTTAEAADLLALYKSADASLSGAAAADRLQVLIAGILQSPDVHFHFVGTTGVASTSGAREKVDAYTIADRLSYQLTDTMPDDALLEAARTGGLSTLAGIKIQAVRLLDSAKGRAHVRRLFSFWLKLGTVTAPAVASSGRFGFATDVTSRNRVRDAVVNETLDFADSIVFDRRGTYQDLMNSDVAFPKTAEIAKILGLGVSTDSRGVSTGGSRRGLIMRPSLTISNNERERVIHRGVLLRTRILCDEIPPPPPDADQTAADNVSAVDPLHLSSRDLASATTKNTSCMGCHSQLNPLGFTLGNFGPLGERRTTERVFDSTGAQTAMFTPDTSAQNVNVDRYEDSVSDENSLTDLVRSSEKGRACFARMALRVGRMRTENANDGCQLADTSDVLRSNQPLFDALIGNTAAEDIFWKGK